jgi:beta-lactamase class A
MKRLLLILIPFALSACSTLLPDANANIAPPQVTTTPLDERIEQIIPILKGEAAPEDYFDPTFFVAVPKAQLDSIMQSFSAQYGQPLKVLNVDKKSASGAALTVDFEKAVGTFNINITPVTPHKVNGLLATGFTTKNDSIAKIGAEFAALPGNAGYIIEELNDGTANRIVAEYNAGNQFAIGSTFKLYILAELASQIDARERNWSDTTPLAHRSFSSAATNRWPKDVPVTLSTLALQMITVSDNSATDTLLHFLGRSAVERKLAQIGHRAPDKTLPFLSTVEAFAMKSSANAELRTRYLAASEADQRAIITKEQAKLGFDQVDNQTFAAGPAYIDTLEWFASPYDLSNLLNHIRRTRNDRMIEILSVNSGLPPANAANWQYVGFKGGSEPGVISLSYLLHAKTGQWYAVTGSWNDPAKVVDETTFAALMARLVQSVE